MKHVQPDITSAEFFHFFVFESIEHLFLQSAPENLLIKGVILPKCFFYLRNCLAVLS